MAPNQTDNSNLLYNSYQTPIKEPTPITKLQQKYQIVWQNVVIFFLLHAYSLYALWWIFIKADWKTLIFLFTLGPFFGIGITGGAHRLWAHRCFKAKLPLRILLMIMQSICMQNHIYEWARDHRVHHKYTDTNADPHNAKNGFFFSHIGWLLVKKHKDVITKGKNIDMSDLEADSVVMFQKKYYYEISLGSIWVYVLIHYYFLSNSLYYSFLTAGVLRYTLSLNFTWLVNSAAHIYGTKPYDKSIKPTENWLVSLLAGGEGWHNYHHCFPWDYKAAELGNYRLNITTAFLDFMSVIGWAYDLKTSSPEMVSKRVARTGDGSWQGDKKVVENDHYHENAVWGWGDKDMPMEEVEVVKAYNKLTET